MSIKQLVQAGFGAFGLRLTRLSNEPKHYYDQMDIVLFGFEAPRFFTQPYSGCRGNHGYWTRAALKYFPDAYYTLIEPQEYLRERAGPSCTRRW